MMSTLKHGAQRTLVAYMCSSPGPIGVLEDHCSSAELDQTTLQPLLLSQMQSAFTWPKPSSL